MTEYSANLCLHSMRILRGDTTVQNRTAKLNALMQEVSKVNELLNQGEHYFTNEDKNRFIKQVGLRAEHLKH